MARARGILRVIVPVAAVAAAYYVAYPSTIRPRIKDWGATEIEATEQLPGDEFVPNPQYETTRAVTIDAPPDMVWPWLVQVGHNRGGLYTDRQSATEIMPEFQNLQIDDVIELLPNFKVTVSALEANKSLVLTKRANLKTGEDFSPDEPLPEQYYIWSLTWHLTQIGENKTRLLIRNRLNYSPNVMFGEALRPISEPAIFVTERKHLLGIKERAERNFRKTDLKVA